MLIPLVVVIPGLIAAVTVQGLGAKTGDLQFNNAVPILISRYLPNGMLGIAITGLLAAFMAGVAANVTAFNTVASYDLWQAYVRKDEPDQYYVRFGRIATVAGILIAIGTAFIAAGYNSMMDYIQALFSFFNAPLFATFIIAMFWRRATPWAGFWGLLAGTVAAVAVHFLHSRGPLDLGSPLAADFWGAVAAFVVDAAVTVGVSLATRPKPDDELRGLVWGLTETEDTSSERDPAERVCGAARPCSAPSRSSSPPCCTCCCCARRRHRDRLRDRARGARADRRDRGGRGPRPGHRAASLFDLRLVIGGLLGLYGAVLTGMGLFASAASRAKAAGININLWAGLAMLAAAGVFLAWALLRPLRAEDLRDTDGDRPEAG